MILVDEDEVPRMEFEECYTLTDHNKYLTRVTLILKRML
jgi:hypothetical protein